MEKSRNVYPPGLSKPIRVTQGKGDHAELGTISKAVYVLMAKGADVRHTFVFCPECDAYHVAPGMEITEDAQAELKAHNQAMAQSARTKNVSRPMRL